MPDLRLFDKEYFFRNFRMHPATFEFCYKNVLFHYFFFFLLVFISTFYLNFNLKKNLIKI